MIPIAEVAASLFRYRNSIRMKLAAFDHNVGDFIRSRLADSAFLRCQVGVLGFDHRERFFRTADLLQPFRDGCPHMVA
jgi:hypothetical protein